MVELNTMQRTFAELADFMRAAYVDYDRLLDRGTQNSLIIGSVYSNSLSKILERLNRPSGTQTKLKTLQALKENFYLFRDNINDALVAIKELYPKEWPEKQATIAKQFQTLSEFLTLQLHSNPRTRS